MPNQEITAPFTNSGSPALGLSPTIRIRDVSDGSLVITDEAMTEVGDGNYSYTFTSYDPNENYAIRCDGGGSLPNAERYTFGGNENYIDDIATTVSGIEDDVDTILVTVSDIDENVNNLDITDLENDVTAILTTVSGIDENVDTLLQSDSDLTDLENDVASILTTVSGIDENVNVLQTDMDALVIDFARALGLMQENYFLDQTSYTTYQGVKLLTSGRIRIYSVAGSVGTGSDVTATYNVTSNWTNDELDDYKVVKA